MSRIWRDIRQALADCVLVGDGAFGTQLHAAGLGPGDCAEEWNASKPDIVMGVTAAYVRAGSRVVTTNTFGGSALKLAAYGLGDRCEELNALAGSLARQAAGDAFVVGSVGPCGKVLEPYGDTTEAEARASFARQVRGLVAGGVDGVLVETMISIEEALAALGAAAEAAPELPRFCTMTFQPEGRTSFGVSVERAVGELEEAGVDGVGLNCGTGSEQALPIVESFCRAASVPVIVQPNAGLPQLVAGKAVFDETPEIMAAQAVRFRDAGARWIGGCCGSTPAHIRAVAEALADTS